jgi:hypothetical protein
MEQGSSGEWPGASSISLCFGYGFHLETKQKNKLFAIGSGIFWGFIPTASLKGNLWFWVFGSGWWLQA